MNQTKFRLKKLKIYKRLALEDMRYLQKKISGRSVYRNMKHIDPRKTKHRNLRYQYQD